MKKLSIIIPIYNVEDYLVNCLDSIYTQGIDEDVYEIIAVIDGSPDRCLDLAREYASRHTNLVVINKTNGGVASARNKGIEVAQGKYIMFVDPDDYLIPRTLESFFSSAIDQQEAEIIIMRSFVGDKKREVYCWGKSFVPGFLFSGIEVYQKGYTRGSVCGAVFNKYFLNTNNLFFPLGVRNSEDSIFFIQCQILAKKILFADIKAYSVTERPNSASRNINKSMLDTWFNALRFLEELKSKKQYTDIEKSMIDCLKYSMISSITNKSILMMGWNAKNYIRTHSVDLHLPICKEDIRNSSFINGLMKRIMNVSYDLFFLITFIRAKL